MDVIVKTVKNVEYGDQRNSLARSWIGLQLQRVDLRVNLDSVHHHIFLLTNVSSHLLLHLPREINLW